MIRNIIFDMGGVLIRWEPALFLELEGVPREDRPLLLREVFGSVEWVQLDRGSVSPEEGLASMCRRLPPRLHAAARELTMGWWRRGLLPVEGMGDLVREVKGLGLGVYLLSNAKVDLPLYFDRIPGSECFDGKIVSADWKLLKPQREIYEALLREHRLRAEECFFIDDLPINVEGAWEAGLRGTVFDGDLSRLRRELRDAGVPCAAGEEAGL